MNQAQVRNPHRIYPGDVLVLDRSAAEMRLSLLSRGTVRLSPQARQVPLEAEPVPTIPTSDIEPFLSKPLVIAQNQLDDAPRIVRTQENRVALGAGNVAYVQGITSKDQGEFWYLFRPGSELVDPVSKESLGYEAIYLGDARVARYGPVSTVEIIKSPIEITAGDRLLPAPREIALESYVPRPPARAVDARIIGAYGGLYEVGPNSIVALSKGARDGLEVGHVLAIYRNLNAATNQLRESSLWGRTGLFYDEKNPKHNYREPTMTGRTGPMYGRVGPFGAQYKQDKTTLAPVTLPDERYGLLMVFRVFERASYALVLNADRPVAVLDVVTNP